MPGSSRHRFEFVGKEPLILLLLFVLLAINTISLLMLDFAGGVFLQKIFPHSHPCEALARGETQLRVPGAICWYASHDIAIQFFLLILIAGVLVIYRKRVRYIGPH